MTEAELFAAYGLDWATIGIRVTQRPETDKAG